MRVRLLALALALVMLLSACAAGPETQAPAAEETAAPAEAAEPTPLPVSTLPVVISEVMSRNRASLAAPDGSFPDWVELFNPGGERAVLDGCRLLCGSESCPLDGVVLEPGEFRVLFCAREGGQDLTCAISAEGEELLLVDAAGLTADSLRVPALAAGESFAVGEDGQPAVCRWPSPGQENSAAGYDAFQQTRTPAPDAPAIAEAVVFAYTPLMQEKEPDWVELVNPTDRALELSDYYLSDKENDRLLYRLPQQSLQPGGRIVIRCGAEEEGGAPFGLSSGGESLFLSRADGSLCDYVYLRGIPLGASVGREKGRGGFLFFETPSPGEANTDGRRRVSDAPRSLTADGVFEDVETVAAALAGEGEIRYSLDGSLPTEDSPLYEGSVELTQSGVLRARCFAGDCLPGKALTLCYVINEGHSLPVLCLACDPEEIFGPRGIYTCAVQDLEIPCTAAFFDGEESFRIDAGLKMHGFTSRFHMKKKSFKLCFRDRYEGELEHKLFETDVDRFSSILIRSAQETDGLSHRPSTYMRDALIHKVAVRSFPELPSEDCRYCILYINGEYRGIYNLREAHSVDHYAKHYGVAPEKVRHWKIHWGNTIPFDADYYHSDGANMADDAVFAEMTQHLDLESVMDWLILQAYNGNDDPNSPNMRFYWNEETQKLSYALVDLDMGMFKNIGFPVLLHCGYPYSRMANRLFQNAAFRERFAGKILAAVEGPLSEESFLALIDEFADQLRPEIARDRALWGGSEEEWEQKVQSLRDYVCADGGRARTIISTLSWSASYRLDEMERFFPEELWK